VWIILEYLLSELSVGEGCFFNRRFREREGEERRGREGSGLIRRTQCNAFAIAVSLDLWPSSRDFYLDPEFSGINASRFYIFIFIFVCLIFYV